PAAGDGVPASGAPAPLGGGERALRASRHGRRGCSSPHGRGAARSGPRARREPAGAHAVGRRAAAPRAGARLGAAPGAPLPRRADRQPRPRRDARDRDPHQGVRRRRDEDRDVHAQPRPGAAPGRRSAVPAPGAPRGARPRRAVFLAAPVARSGGVHKRRSPMALISRIALALLVSLSAQAQERFITVASTTLTEQSGLFKYLLPIFEKKAGIQVRVVAVGTGQALDIGRRGDADVVFVHAKPLEEKFMAEGQGVKRYDVMYNDFVLVGPKSDPAKVSGTKDIVAALRKIRAAQA